ncbi:imidazolonepropionase [Brevibacterium daeguense]|uniref:Imidazolonepropionase n=1 Tax=Brevibacterium daeguense TaxID=909936 RepID=A0ABP8EF83_9MICO
MIPGFVDSHNHLVFAGDRSAEFAARVAGEPYSAGGIATTVAATREASEEELEANLVRLLGEAERSGTTTFEIKTGYGLTLDDELRALRIINRHTEESTLMAAHVVPPEYLDNPDGYVDLVIEEIIPAAAGQAKWIDVFCEEGAFTVEQAERIITAGKGHGLRPRLHANQLTAGGALQLAARTGCVSADHATFASDEDLAALAAAGTVVTLLPGVEFSTRQPYPDARRYFAAGATVAIASDCNPGSCFTNSIPFCIAVAVRDMRFTVDQAVWAATAGGARALDRADIGRLTVGARADFSILDAPSYRHLAYRPGVQLIAKVYRAGEQIAANQPAS